MDASSSSQERSRLSPRAAAALVTAAAAEGRDTHAYPDVAPLIAALGLRFAPGTPAAAREPAVSVSLVHTREFGLVLSAGAGGIDATLDAASFRPGRGRVCAAVELTDAADFLEAFRHTVAWQKLAAVARRDGEPGPDAPLAAWFDALLDLAGSFAPEATGTLRELTLEGVRAGAELVVTSARCAVGPAVARPLPRPLHKIDKLLHPRTLGLVGVSATGMNFGRIILRNLVGSGYPKERITIVKPGEAEIDGVRCVEGLAALDGRLDLLIVAVSADAVYALVDEIIATDSVDAVMLIPGGLGETAKSRAPAAAMAARINAAHGAPGGGPIFLGANCLGVVSHPGGYDSWFIPLERLPKPQKKAERDAAMISQSGAFMITRLSQNPWLDPRYMLAIGNQTDLTHGDLLAWFGQRPEIATVGVYVEGFRDLDGLAFARAARAAVLGGKDVVVYKAGRTPPGVAGAFGHTASVAGDYDMFASILRQAGAIVAEDVSAFDDLFYIAGALHAKRIGGRRLGAISGAGFEAVSMADAIDADAFAMEMGTLAPATVERVNAILAARKLDALVEVNNPIDINPGADDEAHLAITEAFLEDPAIDAVVVALDPTAPAVRALESSRLRPGYDLDDPKSTVHLMPPLVARHDKPVIGVADAGRLYDAMSARLMDHGVCVFRNCARATRALVRYVDARLHADALRRRA
ncbi:MAG: CoA-binding protein [Burkholderiales bacterium]